MSSRTTSGWNSSASVERRGAVVGDPDLLAVEPRQEPGQAAWPRPRCRPRRGCAPRQRPGPRSAVPVRRRRRPAAAAVETGRRTTNSLPRPGPSLVAAIRPPCISTRVFDQAQADPQPALRMAVRGRRPGRTSRRPAAASRARSRCRCRGPGRRPRPPRASPRAGSGRRARCT